MKFSAAFFLIFMSIFQNPSYAGEQWTFDIVNKSKLVADGFRTNESGKWSPNWLHTEIAPGDVSNMDFGHADGSCTVRTQIHFTDNTYFEYDVDYCKASRLYIYNRSVKWD